MFWSLACPAGIVDSSGWSCGLQIKLGRISDPAGSTLVCSGLFLNIFENSLLVVCVENENNFEEPPRTAKCWHA